MRLATFILAFYIIALNAVPCADSVSFVPSSDDAHQSALGHESGSTCDFHADNHANHDHDGECDDTCSPFCSCDCCGVTVVFFDNSIPFIPLVNYFSNSDTPYMQAQSYEHASRVFQPPKLS